MERASSYKLENPKDLQREKLRLSEQAKALFEIEFPQFKESLMNADTIVDLGCGNATYIKLIQSRFPDKHYIGIDRNQHLMTTDKQVDLFCADIMEVGSWKRKIPSNEQVVFILRFVLQHMTKGEMDTLLKSLLEHFPGSKVIVIEISGSEVELAPNCHAIKKLNDLTISYQEGKGGDRCIGPKVAPHFEVLGYSNIENKRYSINSSNLGWEKMKDIFLPIWMSGLKLVEVENDKEVLLSQVNEWFNQTSEVKDSCLDFTFNMIVAET